MSLLTTQRSRFATYAIEGGRGTGVCCVNGAAAHLASVGDRLIVCCYAAVPEANVRTHEPFIVLVDAENRAHTVKRGESEGVRFRDAANSLVVRSLKQ